MRSQLLLLMAVAAANNLFSAGAFADFEVKGTGVYRTERGCLKVLPAYEQKLVSLGLTLTKPMECIEVQGEIEAYEPTFWATSDQNVVTETAVAAPMQDEPSCKASLRALLHVVADASERVLEASCIPMSQTDFENGELVIGQYQPMVILLKTKPMPVAASSPASPARAVASPRQNLLR